MHANNVWIVWRMKQVHVRLGIVNQNVVDRNTPLEIDMQVSW